VRELEPGGEVADRRDGRHIGPAVLVHDHEATVDRHPGLFVPEPGRDRAAADGDQHHLRVEGLPALQGDGQPVRRLLHPFEHGPQLVGDPAPAEGTLQQLGAGFVLGRQQVGEHLDDGHLGAE
jgi:hypothetical protein